MDKLQSVERTLTQHGNSLAIVVPKGVIQIMGWKNGEKLKVPFHLFEKISDK